MIHAGLDLSRKRLDYHLMDEGGRRLAAGAVAPTADGLAALSARVVLYGQPVRAAIEAMTGARFVHDGLERAGWEVSLADAQRVKGLAPLACKTDRIDAHVLAELSRRDLVPAGCPPRRSKPTASAPAFGCISFATAPASSTASIPP